jgi:hypothetical protein
MFKHTFQQIDLPNRQNIVVEWQHSTVVEIFDSVTGYAGYGFLCLSQFPVRSTLNHPRSSPSQVIIQRHVICS